MLMCVCACVCFKAQDVGLTCACHLSYIMSDDIFYDSMLHVIIYFFFFFLNLK